MSKKKQKMGLMDKNEFGQAMFFSLIKVEVARARQLEVKVQKKKNKLDKELQC